MDSGQWLATEWSVDRESWIVKTLGFRGARSTDSPDVSIFSCKKKKWRERMRLLPLLTSSTTYISRIAIWEGVTCHFFEIYIWNGFSSLGETRWFLGLDTEIPGTGVDQSFSRSRNRTGAQKGKPSKWVDRNTPPFPKEVSSPTT